MCLIYIRVFFAIVYIHTFIYVCEYVHIHTYADILVFNYLFLCLRPITLTLRILIKGSLFIFTSCTLNKLTFINLLRIKVESLRY